MTTIESSTMGLARYDDGRDGFRIIRLCRGRDAGKDFYAFIAIEPQNLPYFEERYRESAFSDFRAFGHELLRGWGREPPEDVIEHLKAKYRIVFSPPPGDVLEVARKTARLLTDKDEEFTFLSPQRTSETKMAH